mgnify:CR=1 FL=1
MEIIRRHAPGDVGKNMLPRDAFFQLPGPHAPLLRLPECLRRFQLAGHVRQLPQPGEQAAGRTFADGEPVAALQHENGALLDAADAGGITLSYEEKQAVEGKKRKQLVKVVKRYAFSEEIGRASCRERV